MRFFGITKIYWTQVDRKRVLMIVRHARTVADSDKAIARQKKTVARNPDSATAHLYLGNGLYSRGQVDAARSEWEKALTLDDSIWAEIAKEYLEQTSSIGEVDAAGNAQRKPLTLSDAMWAKIAERAREQTWPPPR